MKVELSPPQNKGYESPLKMMRNHFHFILKALFVFQIFMFFVLTFWLCKKKKTAREESYEKNVYDITNWTADNYNTHIAQYLKKTNRQ